MLDKRCPRRRASQPVIVSNQRQEALPRASSFLSGLKAWRPRTKRTENEANGRRKAGSSANQDDVDDSDDVVEVLTIHPKHSDKEQPGNDSNSGDETDDAELSRSKSSLHIWRKFTPKTKPEARQATVMYSISFYPWKMEPHCYYSHPEAAANWVPDTASSRCQICLTSFTLTRRRHHCRLCGHLVCANCSHDRTYLPFTGSAPSQHRLIKDGAPQRTCSACASTLRNMAAQDDPRVKRFTVAVSSAQSTALPRSITSSRSVVEVEVERPSPWLRRTGMALTDSDVEDEEFFLESTKALQLDQRSRGTTHHFPLRLSVTRAEELDEILSARASSQVRAAVEKPRGRQFVISSAWLEQWLQYVRVDSASSDDATSNSSTTQLSRRGSSRNKSSTKCRLARPPRPGPVTNYALLDFVNGELVPKSQLQRGRGRHGRGDYRVVSQEVWVAFLELYGGGPSIQVPLSNEADNSVLVANQRQQWIISQLDDSLPALAVASPPSSYSTATRLAARQRGNETIQQKTAESRQRNRSTQRRLVATASMSSMVKKPTGRCESPLSRSSSQWKLWGEGGLRARSETMGYENPSEMIATITEQSATEESLIAVSAFASAATLARQRSAASLSRHSAAVSSRANGSLLETE
ncbi:FYVE [Phytophthora citrophthora]|uniref:FYVE n=1 Tax=Phytophthora citrophthora TaxID=4793 RepID=A0AAD9G5C5_9STRA|nr:FYVE [Phytophthora citrophthora]